MNKLFFTTASLVISAVLLLGVTSEEVLANGTETLGPPANISIGSGTGIVTGGTGLVTQPGTIDINVPGDVIQALLYWVCTGTGDDTVTVNSTSVTGDNIGERQPVGVSFRADITELVSAGLNNLEIEDLVCGGRSDGAGVLVIFDDGSDIATIRIRDGFDFAFSKATIPAGKVAVAQTFNFAAKAFDRTATLYMFIADCEALRPDRIRIRILDSGGNILSTTFLDNQCQSGDGDQWDPFVLEVVIPAGANRVNVLPQSKKTNLTTLPDSLIWVVAALTIPPEVVEEGVCLLLIDEDTIDNGIQSIINISNNAPNCGGGDPAVCVNDSPNPVPGQRTLLFTQVNDITPFSGLVLPTGQESDAGLFIFTKPDPQVSLQTPQNTFTIAEFIAATGNAADENNLDKIDGVVPLDTGDEITPLLNKQCCAVVYDSDISPDVPQGFASLKGATYGLTAFEVTAVGDDPDGSVLPPITVNLLDSSDVLDVCGRVVPPQPE